MKNRISGILATIVLVIIALFLAADVGYSLYKPDRLQSGLPSCQLDVISGDVMVMKKDGISWVTADDGMSLEQGSRVRTTDTSQASLVFSQGTTTKLEPETDVIIASLGDQSQTDPDVIVLKQQTGITWNQVKKSDADCSFKIKTSSSDIAVHGTLFAAEVEESGETRVATTEGEVSVSAKGEEVSVFAGEMTTVKRGDKPSGTSFIPIPTNELVFTVDKQVSPLVTDPSGSSTGYLSDESHVNQIAGSQISSDGGSTQSIRIRDASTGEYTVVLRGASSIDSLKVEGFAEGERAFIHSESSNVTSAGDLIVKLHCDVIDGVLQNVSVLNSSSQKKPTTSIYTAAIAPIAIDPDTSDMSIDITTDSSAAQGKDDMEPFQRIFGMNSIIQWITSGAIVILLGSLFLFIYNRS